MSRNVFATEPKEEATATRLMLIHRSPKEWQTRIKAIMGRQYRVQAACIVWWDFKLGDRMKAPNFFTRLMEKWDPDVRLRTEQLYRALISLDYIPSEARTRVEILRKEYGYVDGLMKTKRRRGIK